RRDKIESLAGRHREMDGSGAASRGGIETFAPLSRIVAAKHDAASSHDLGSKPDLAFPPGRLRKQVRQRLVLEVRNPGDRRQAEAPAKELRGLEDDIDAMLSEQFRHRRHAPAD